jgi:glycine cleavage system H protein
MTERFYTKTHEWVCFETDGTALVGVSEQLVQSQKNPSCINLCDEGDVLRAGDNAGDVEFLKGVVDVHAPVSGVVDAVNDALLRSPQTLAQAPLTWLFSMRQVKRARALLTEAQYIEYLTEGDRRA